MCGPMWSHVLPEGPGGVSKIKSIARFRKSQFNHDTLCFLYCSRLKLGRSFNIYGKHYSKSIASGWLFHSSTSQLSFGLLKFRCFLEFLGVPWAEISSDGNDGNDWRYLAWNLSDSWHQGEGRLPLEKKIGPMKNNAWKTTFLLFLSIFRGHVFP